MSIVELKNVEVAFPQKKGEPVKAVNNVSLSIEKGDIYGIVGFSGAGKSTLVRTVNLLQKPTAGSITVDGTEFVKDGKQVISNKELQLKRRNIGMIFQGFNLLNETTVLENVAFALKHEKLSDEELEKRSLELLDLVDLKDKADFYPAELSGGQQQRVAIARALANNPDILISDEATSALDPQNTQQILDLLKRLNKKFHLTVILITHEMDAVKKIATKVAVMEHGNVIEDGSLRDVFLHPKQDLTKKFVGGSLEAISTLNSLALDKLGKNEAIYQLVYSVANVTKSIIIELYKQIGVEVSMLYGNVELLNEEPIGTLVVLVKGDPAKQKQTQEFLAKQNVTFTRLDEKGNVMISFLSKYLPNVVQLGWGGDAGWGTSIFQTLFMTFWSAIFGGILGIIFGVILVLTKDGGIRPNKFWYNFSDKLVSIFRAIPFIILLAFVAPVTQKIVGTQIGMKAALVPLTLGVFPFYARQVQVALESVDPGKVEAAESLGSTARDIIFDVYLRESRSELIRVSTVTIISLIGLTAMAGAVGAGGLGNTAISYGYNRFNNDVTLVATVLVIILIFIVQIIGDFFAKRMNHQSR